MVLISLEVVPSQCRPAVTTTFLLNRAASFSAIFFTIISSLCPMKVKMEEVALHLFEFFKLGLGMAIPIAPI